MRRARSASRSATPIISPCRPAPLAFLLARGRSTGLARILLLLIALAFLANTAVGIYHAGVEWKWWPGPTECTGAFELKWGEGGIVDTPIVRCDEASWRFLGLSFAGWNAVVSAFLASHRRLWRHRGGVSSRQFQAGVIAGLL